MNRTIKKMEQKTKITAFTHETEAVKERANYFHQLKMEQKRFDKEAKAIQQKQIQESMAFLWDMKFKYMREMDERMRTRTERAHELFKDRTFINYDKRIELIEIKENAKDTNK